MTFKLKTVDVWDTLLRRRCHPEFIKVAVARYVALRPGINLRPLFSGPWEIYRERLRAEAELAEEAQRKGQDNEYVLEEVFRRWFGAIIGSAWSEDLVTEVSILELSLEKSRTYVDPQIKEFLGNHPADETLFLSDFYMRSDQIRQLLEHHALDSTVPGGISSCDVGLNKRSGRLFKHLHEKLGLEPAEHVHIGDNAHSDVHMPKSMGVEAVHYAPAEEHARRLKRAEFFEDRSKLFHSIAERVSQLRPEHAGARTAEQHSAFAMGIKAAPLFSGFLLWVAEKSLKDAVERLWFFTKEGDFFLELWRVLFPDRSLVGHKLPPEALLEVSRVSTFGPSISAVNKEEMMRVWSLYPSLSMGSLLRTLGLDPNNFATLCEKHGVGLSEPVDEPWLDARVQSLLADEDFESMVLAACGKQRWCLEEYLRAQGWESGKVRRYGVVDIGWRGTIQDNLALIYPEVSLCGYYLGLQRFLNPQPDNCYKTAFGPNNNVSPDWQDLLGPVSPLEMLCGSPHGSVTDYVEDADGHIRPKREADASEVANHQNFVHFFQSGVLQAAACWSPHIENEVITSEELREPACRIWRRLVTDDNPVFANRFADLKQSDFFGIGDYVHKGAVPSLGAILSATYSRKARRELVLFLRQHQWPAGIWSRSDLNLLQKTLLVSLMKTAAAFKDSRNLIRRSKSLVTS